MAIVNSQSAEDRITLAVDATLWSDELQAVLTSARYHLVMMDLADSAADVVSASSVDAVIASTQFPLNTELADLAETRNTMLLLVSP
ncbi:MAG: hypothetical protein AAFR67_15630 [Chloroflexota bacterium]